LPVDPLSMYRPVAGWKRIGLGTTNLGVRAASCQGEVPRLVSTSNLIVAIISVARRC
jgi:hypothetical protein